MGRDNKRETIDSSVIGEDKVRKQKQKNRKEFKKLLHAFGLFVLYISPMVAGWELGQDKFGRVGAIIGGFLGMLLSGYFLILKVSEILDSERGGN